MPPETAVPGIPSWVAAAGGWLAPTLAVAVGFILTAWQSRRAAKRVERKVEATNEANAQQLKEIHRLVNGGRLGKALRRVDELEQELYETKNSKPQRNEDDADINSQARG